MVVWRKIPQQNETSTFKHDLNFSHHRLLNPDPVSALAHIRKKHIEDQAMRTHKLNKSRKLYRSDNTTTRHYSINPGGEYRWGRNRKKAEDELLAKRETMHGRQKRGRDYTPLFYFLVKQIGQPWDKVFSEVCGRLDTTEPVFWLVALHEHQKRDLVRIGDSSFYPGLFVDGNGILQQVNPSITGKDVKVICRCCTHTYMGEPVPGKYE